MGLYLYKKYLVSKPNVEEPKYVLELLASGNYEVENYKGPIVDTFTSNHSLCDNPIKAVINTTEKYRLELRTEKFEPDLPIYLILKRQDINVEYFVMVKDDILDLEDGFVFCTDPLKFLDSISPTTPEQWKKFESSDNKIWINFKSYEMTVHYEKIDFSDGMSIG